jgi:hypothetical protein
MLYNSGLRTVEDVAKAPLEKLAETPRIGRDLAYRIKSSARALAGLGGEAA